MVRRDIRADPDLEVFVVPVKIAQLGELSLFAGLSPAELERAAAFGTFVDVAEGHVLCAAGTLGREVFVVVAGSVGVSRDGEMLGVVGAGAVVGESAVLSRHVRDADAVTLCDTTVLALSAAEFVSLLDAVPAVAVRLLSDVAARRS
jgi:voltage-gated potassium channel